MLFAFRRGEGPGPKPYRHTYIYTHPRRAHQGLAHEGPEKPTRTRPKRAQGSPQGPWGPTRVQGADKSLDASKSAGPDGPQGPRGPTSAQGRYKDPKSPQVPWGPQVPRGAHKGPGKPTRAQGGPQIPGGALNAPREPTWTQERTTAAEPRESPQGGPGGPRGHKFGNVRPGAGGLFYEDDRENSKTHPLI